MSAARTYDEETRARAVRMYTERIRDPGESKLTARRAVGAVLDITSPRSATGSARGATGALDGRQIGVRPGLSPG